MKKRSLGIRAGIEEVKRSFIKKSYSKRRKSKSDNVSETYGQLEDRKLLDANPVGIADTEYHTPLNTALVISTASEGVLANDFDAEGATLSASLHSGVSNGSLTLNSDGTFSYTPNTGFQGVDFFRYTVSDGTNSSRVTPVHIKVATALSAAQNDEERVVDNLLHDGTVALSQSLGAGPSLSYRSDTIPVVLIPVDTFLAPGSTIPNNITASLSVDGVSSGTVEYSTSGMTTGDTMRFVLRTVNSSSTTGMYDWDLTVDLNYTGFTQSKTFQGQTPIVNRIGTEFGDGWWIDGYDRIYEQTDGALLVNGDGTTMWFAKSGSTYLKAVGDTTFSTLTEDMSGYTLTDKWGHERTFGTDGKILTRQMSNHATADMTYSYDMSGNLETIEDRFGREFTLAYTSGKLSSVTDFGGRDSDVTISSNKLTSVTVADETFTGYTAPTWNYTYSSIGGTNFLASVTDPDSNTTSYAYHAGSRTLSQITFEDASTWSLTATTRQGLKFGGTTGNALTYVDDIEGSFTNERGKTTFFNTDNFGNTVRTARPNGSEWTYEYDADNLLYRITEADPDGGGSLESPVTKFGYTLLGDLVTTVDSEGNSSTATYTSSLHRVQSTTDELGHTTNYTYDTVGNMLTETDAEGNTWTYTYNSEGSLLTVTSPDPDGAGNPLSSYVTTYEYDTTLFNLPDKITWDDTNFQEFTYTTSGQLASFTDELGRVTIYSYDPLDRLVEMTLPDPDGGGALSSPVYTTAYGANLLVSSETDALGNVTSYTYNNRNWLEEITLPDPDGAGGLSSPKYTYSYDAVGNLTSEVRPEFANGASIDYTYDAYDRLTNMDGPVSGQSFEYIYDRLDRVLQETDPFGRDINYSYDSLGRTASVVDDGGETVSYVYDDASRMTSMTDQIGRTTAYTYLDNNWLETTTLPEVAGEVNPGIFTQTYDALGRLLSSGDPAGRARHNIYNSRGWVVERVGLDPDNNESLAAESTYFEYDAVGNLTEVTDALGNETDYTYDALDRLDTVTMPDPDGVGGVGRLVYSYEYDAVGNQTLVSDSWGRKTETEYDNLYRRTQVTLPDPDGGGGQTSPVWSFSYNAQTLLEDVTDPMSAVASRTYDDAGRLASVTNVAGVTTTYAYDALDRKVSETLPDPDGTDPLSTSVTSYGYDLLSRLTSTTDANGDTTSYAYDKAGQLLSLTDASDNTTYFAYDERGRKTLERDSRGYTKTYNYNSVDRLVRTVDQMGRVIRYVNEGYDSFERWYEYDSVPTVDISTDTEGGGGFNEVQSVDLTNLPATTGTDDNFFRLSVGGQVALIGAGATATEVEAALESLESVTDVTVAGSSGAFEVTFGGNLANTNVAPMIGDALRADLGESVHEIQFTYDELWRMTDAGDSFADYTYTYDGLGRVTSVTEDIFGLTPTIQLDNEYNLVGQLVRVSATVGGTADWETTYEYDDLDRVITIQQSGQSGGNTVSDKRVKFNYNSLGQRTFVNRYEATSNTNPAIRTVFTYDNGNRIASLTHRQVASSGLATVAFHGYTYAYDGQSRINSITSSEDGLSEYTFDQIGQLTSAEYSSTIRIDESYTFDETGNRTNGTVIDDGNLLVEDGTEDYVYDKNGNRIERSVSAIGYYEYYEWDHRNRLVGYSLQNSGSPTLEVTLSYDAFNRLIRMEAGNGTTIDVDEFFAGFDDFDDPTLSFDGGSATDLKDRFLMFRGEVFAQESRLLSGTSDGNTMWSLNDHLGTARDIAQYISSATNFEVVRHRIFDSYGRKTDSGGGSYFAFGFTGQLELNYFGLNYHHNRWYDTRIGRWASDDPIGFLAGDVNLQRYAGNMPSEFTDPTGLDTQLQTMEEDVGHGQPGATYAPTIYRPSGFWSSIGANFYSIGQTYYGIGQYATGNSDAASETWNAAYENGSYGQTKDADGVIYYGTRGSLGVSAVAIGSAVALESVPAVVATARPLSTRVVTPVLNRIGSWSLPYRTPVTKSVQLSRFFVTQTGYRQVVKKSLFNGVAKRFGLQWHHWAIPQATARSFGNAGLTRLTHAGWNLVPIPAKINGAIGAGGLGFNVVRATVGSSPIVAGGGGFIFGYEFGELVFGESEDER